MKIFTLIKLLLSLSVCVIILMCMVIGTILYHRWNDTGIKDVVGLVEHQKTLSYKEGYNHGVVDILRLDDTYKRIDIKRFEDLRTKRFADYRR